MKFLPNLNPLRFILALLVMLFHIPQFFSNRELPYFDGLPIFHKGTEAVYAFFVLSGFLIIRLLYIEKNISGKIGMKNFYMRRVLRILPLYFLILCSGLVYYNVFLQAIGIEFDNEYNITNTLLLCLFFLPNVAAKLYQPGGVIEILWSIGIEEQFYLLVAPILTFIRYNLFIKTLLFFTASYFLLFVSNVFPFLQEFDFLYFYFSIGGLLAVLNERYKINALINNYGKMLLITLFIMYFTTTIFSELPLWGYHLIGMIILSTFILSISFNPLVTIKNKNFNYLGKISYGIYMYHPLVMQAVGFALLQLNKKQILPNMLMIILSYVLVIGITIITSHFSYQYFEKYFLKQKIKYRD